MDKKVKTLYMIGIALVAVTVLLFIILSISESKPSSHYTAKPGECTYCDGVGWYMGADSNGKMTVRKTCPHCHGTGLAN